MNWRRVLIPLARVYWKIFRPHTYGVKAVILHPDGSGKVLLVRHTYGNRNLWNLPGGGFNPKRESPLLAVKREVQEELRVEFIEPRELCVYKTEAEGKQDEVVVMVGFVADPQFSTSKEISEYKWEEISAVLTSDTVARIAKYAIKHL